MRKICFSNWRTCLYICLLGVVKTEMCEVYSRLQCGLCRMTEMCTCRSGHQFVQENEKALHF